LMRLLIVVFFVKLNKNLKMAKKRIFCCLEIEIWYNMFI